MDEKHRRVTLDGSTRGVVRDPDHFCTLAMACAEVDHQRLRDRPWGTLDGWPDQAAGASYAPALLGVARAAPRTRFLVPAPRRSAVAATGNPAR